MADNLVKGLGAGNMELREDFVLTDTDQTTVLFKVSQGGTVQAARSGTGTPATAFRIGKGAVSPFEGYRFRVLDETIDLTSLAALFKDLTSSIPSGAVILSVQVNLEALVEAGGTSVKIGVGPSGDPDKYGLTSAFTKNLKINTIPTHVVLGSSEQLRVNAVTTAGAAGDTNISAGSVRVRVLYVENKQLDDAA